MSDSEWEGDPPPVVVMLKRRIAKLEAEVARLQPAKALAEADMALHEADKVRCAHHWDRPPLAIPDSPEQRAWRSRGDELAAVAQDRRTERVIALKGYRQAQEPTAPPQAEGTEETQP